MSKLSNFTPVRTILGRAEGLIADLTLSQVLLDGLSVRFRILQLTLSKLLTVRSFTSIANWVSFLPLVRNHATQTTSNATLSLITQGLFGIFLVLLILLVEKLVIQVM